MSLSPTYIVIFEGPSNPAPAAPGPVLVPAPPLRDLDLLVAWEPRWSSFISALRPALSRTPQITGDVSGWLVHWEPRWQGFKQAVPPAVARSERRLEGECQAGLDPGSSTLLSVLLHVAAILFLVVIPARVIRSHQLLHDTAKQYQVIYYSAADLPQMMDAGGAQAGAGGRSGGRELYNPRQTIRVARGNKLANLVVDAPRLKLPRTEALVANLLSMPAGLPGMAPAAALPALTHRSPALLPVDAVPPQPRVDRRQLRNAVRLPLDTVQPAPHSARQIAGLKLPELGASHLAPPPISAPVRDTASVARLTLPPPVAVEPPPQAWRNVSDIGVVGLGDARDVIPPAVEIAPGSVNAGRLGALEGTSAEVVPPAPSVASSGNALTGTGMKAMNAAVGALTGGTGTGGGGSGVVLSATPGGAIGLPARGGVGSFSMSPNGGHELGYGGSGGGSGIGHGAGTGSGTTGNGPGAARSGQGLGLGAARPGTSLGNGPGGSGSGHGVPGGIPGITIIGGNGRLTVPGFATRENNSGFPERGHSQQARKPPLTIIASARAGGALNAYDSFKGAKVYTIYVDTRLGIAVLQYAERAAARSDFEADLTAPEPVDTPIPTGLARSHLLISCILDRSGALKNLRVLEAGRLELVQPTLDALQNWRFRPALRGDVPVDVDAILGFEVDTR